MSRFTLSHRLLGERTKILLPSFPLCGENEGSSLTTEYPFAKYFLFAIVMSISVCRGTPRPAERQRAINAYSKCRAAPDLAVTRREDNDTPVQSQSEREKTVAGNEGGSVRTTVGVKLPWCQFAADRLATSHSISGCRGQIEMLLSYQARYKAVYGNRVLFYALQTLNTSLCLAST